MKKKIINLMFYISVFFSFFSLFCHIWMSTFDINALSDRAVIVTFFCGAIISVLLSGFLHHLMK